MLSSQKPILITGCPRSGTTWCGKTISASKEVFYAYEPFNTDAPSHFDIDMRFPDFSTEATPKLVASADRMMKLNKLSHRTITAVEGSLRYLLDRRELASNMSARTIFREKGNFIKPSRVCVKDPIAFFSTDFMTHRYDPDVLIMIRHPAGVISSFMGLDWQSELDGILRHGAPRSAPDLQKRINNYDPKKCDKIEALILQWLIFATHTLDMADRHQEHRVMLHEDLCLQPLARFEELYDWLGLEFTSEIRNKIICETSNKNVVDTKEHTQHAHKRQSRALVEVWKQRLDARVIDRVLNETGDVWASIAKRFAKDYQQRVQANDNTILPPDNFPTISKKGSRQ